MNNKLIFLRQFIGKNKTTAIHICVLNAMVGAVLSMHNILELFGMLLGYGFAIWTLKACFKMRMSPSVKSEFDTYSWKYFQSLPLNKKEIATVLVLSDVLAFLPMIVWCVSFLHFFNASVDFLDYVKTCFLIISGAFLFSAHTLKNIMIYPRAKYAGLDKPDSTFTMLRDLVYVLAPLTALVFLAAKIFNLEGKVLQIFLGVPLGLLKDLFLSPYLYPAVLLLAYMSYARIFTIWQDEKIGYKKFQWNNKRDFPILMASLSFISYYTITSDIMLPSMYQDTPALREVYYKNIHRLNQLVDQGRGNEKNKYGFTPLLTAVHQGNFEIYKMLIDKGLKPGGELQMPGDKHHDGMNFFLVSVDGNSPKIVSDLLKSGENPVQWNKKLGFSSIHVAASNCDSKVLEILVKRKSDLQLLNAKGQTPLHIAAKNKCFANVVMLTESGSDLKVKDKDGKTALDYASVKDMKNYFDRKTRMPAGLPIE